MAVFHRESAGSIPGYSKWDSWWTQWHGKRFFPNFTSIPCQHHLNTAAF